MTSAYISSLRRSLAEEEEAPRLSKPDLRQRFLDWLDSQPEISRVRPYSMTELERALGTQGRYLSPVLLRLGWERRRKWTGKTQYLRYWVPPGA
jgi:hypothetical protein